MRIHLLFVPILLVLFGSCNYSNVLKDLDYEIAPIKSESMLIRAKLFGVINPQKLELELAISNIAQKDIHIEEVEVSTEEGLKARSINFDQPITLVTGKDTTISLTFQPINDLVLYKNTDLPGALNPAYNISIFYKVKGKADSRAMDLTAKMPVDEYQKYKKDNSIPVTSYGFNTVSQFSSKQKAYLEAQILPGSTPFVHISDHELAVSGLNFQIKAYQKNDSLYAKLVVVNHSEFAVKIDTNRLNLISNDKAKGKNVQNISLTKLTGSDIEKNILRKGEKILISIKKYKHTSPSSNLTLSFKNAFTLPSGKFLFYEDVELVKVDR